MRALLRAAPVALALLTAVSLPAGAQGLKVAYVQTSTLLDQAPGRAEAEAQFEKETGTYRDQIKRMSDSLNAMVASFERGQATLAAAARDARAKDIRGKQDEYERRTRELEQKAQARQN
jgi:outer membrane protein